MTIPSKHPIHKTKAFLSNLAENLADLSAPRLSVMFRHIPLEALVTINRKLSEVIEEKLIEREEFPHPPVTYRDPLPRDGESFVDYFSPDRNPDVNQ